MFGNPSLMTRIAIGKGVGFIFGLIGFIAMPVLFGETDIMLRWGILLWYTTVGAVIGVFGVITWHPVLRLPMPWWFRSSLVGAWMNFVLTLFIYDTLQSYIAHLFGDNGAMSSPFWFVLEGAVVGLLIGFLATRFGGEGEETVGK
jgi:hypothetical protein